MTAEEIAKLVPDLKKIVSIPELYDVLYPYRRDSGPVTVVVAGATYLVTSATVKWLEPGDEGAPVLVLGVE